MFHNNPSLPFRGYLDNGTHGAIERSETVAKIMTKMTVVVLMLMMVGVWVAVRGIRGRVGGWGGL